MHANVSSSCARRACSTAARNSRRLRRGRGTRREAARVGPTLCVRVAARARSASGAWMSSASASSRRGRAAAAACTRGPTRRRGAGCCGATTCRPISTHPRPLQAAPRAPGRVVRAACSRSSRSRKPRPKRTGSTASFAAASASTTRACARTRSSVGSSAPSISRDDGRDRAERRDHRGTRRRCPARPALRAVAHKGVEVDHQAGCSCRRSIVADGREQHSEADVDEVDVRDRERDVARDDDALVQDAVDELDERDLLLERQVAAHSASLRLDEVVGRPRAR